MILSAVVWLCALETAAAAGLSGVPMWSLPEPPGADNAATACVDPVTRYVHVSYRVPADAPGEVVAMCTWSRTGDDAWHVARIRPFVSETAVAMARDAEKAAWTGEGRVVERNAAGLVRTVVFDPYPEAQRDGMLDVRFRIRVTAPNGAALATAETRLQADNSDVVYVEDWTKVLQRDAVAPEDGDGVSGWRIRKGEAPSTTHGTRLHGFVDRQTPLRQLTYPLDLRGTYVLFVRGCGIALRLTGDERADKLGAGSEWETLWRWTRMDWQHLVLKQRHEYNGWSPSGIDYVKFVPLTDAVAAALASRYSGPCDKTVIGFWEPYSWSFHEDVQETWQHREPMTAFREARFTTVDCQVNRFGEKATFETRNSDQLIHNTKGDALADESIPETDGVGKMQQYTNTLQSTLRYAKELGLGCHANFGASCCYVGSPIEGDISKQHPEWRYNDQLRYEVPEVREYAYGLVREALDIGAPGITIDFMRYSYVVADAETCNLFLRDLRGVVDEYGAKRGRHIPILVQFPARAVLPPDAVERGSWDLFDYATWAREGWVDILVPSNDDERTLHCDPTEYLAATRGTRCKVMPNVTPAGLRPTGLYLYRVNQLYDAGVEGMYVYQSDQLVTGSPERRRVARLLASSGDVRQYWDDDAHLRPRRSKGIYITSPSRPARGWRSRERVRVWLEGIPMDEVELYLNGELINRFDGPPYYLGTEDRETDSLIPALRESTLLVRAKDGDAWLEGEFAIPGAKPRQ